ncbi:MAG TPA: DUF3109 family protein [Bacteroidales bacterium]|nr:DUF3109 family protein [Bacteroidales bacterium]
MLIIENSLIADELAECMFCCDCHICKGACCVEGDAGAPLEEEEIEIISSSINEIYRVMTPDGIAAIEKHGIYVFDVEGKKVTPLVNGRECAFLVYKNDVAYCAIEIAYKKRKTRFQKPISCHLYPLRIIDYKDFFAVNYHEWHICKPALEKGEKEGIYMYEFLKAPLVRKFGKSWYEELVKISEYMHTKKGSNR